MNTKEKFRKEFNILLECLKLEEKDVIDFSLIGGMTNTNFYLNTLKGRFVSRISGNATEFFINRDNEYSNSISTSENFISPKIKFFDKESGIKITNYIDNAETLSPSTLKKHLKLIAKKVSELHCAKFIFENDFNVKNEFHKYLDTINKNSYALSEKFIKNIKKLNFLFDRVASEDVFVCPCHNDLVPENFVIDKEKNILYIIDWEYSGMNDPAWDLASIFYESNLSYEDEEYFLRLYFSNNDKLSNKNSFIERILIYKIAQCFLWYLWTVIKENNGSSFPNYANRRLENANRLLIEYENKYGFK